MRLAAHNTWRLVALCMIAALVASACGGGGTEELRVRDNGPDGPLPTAPNGQPRNAADLNAGGLLSGSVDVNDLIRRIDALNQENDLCTLLTGDAMADITGADINLTSLVSNPAGFSQLFASLDKLFGHMITIGPAELRPPLGTMKSVWSGLSGIDLRAADAESKAGVLVGSKAVQEANDALGKWVVANCR